MSSKKKLHMALPQQTKLWYEFHINTMGYNYFARLDGKKVEPYIIFYRHMNNPNLLKMVDGTDTSIYTRANKKGWTDGVCHFDYELDTHSMQILTSEQGKIDFDSIQDDKRRNS